MKLDGYMCYAQLFACLHKELIANKILNSWVSTLFADKANKNTI